jgi:hypothetical protein
MASFLNFSIDDRLRERMSAEKTRCGAAFAEITRRALAYYLTHKEAEEASKPAREPQKARVPE